MIGKKKIKEAAALASIKDTDKGRNRENYVISALADHENGFREGYIEGANWAIKEFSEDLWHDAMEEPNPKLNAWIIMQTDKDSWCIVKYGGYNEDGGQTWQREAEKGHTLRWCYLSDILPQEEKGGSDV